MTVGLRLLWVVERHLLVAIRGKVAFICWIRGREARLIARRVVDCMLTAKFDFQTFDELNYQVFRTSSSILVVVVAVVRCKEQSESL